MTGFDRYETLTGPAEMIAQLNGETPRDDQECERDPGPAPAPAFPDGIFPAAIDRYVTSASRSIGVPPEMIAVPLLVTAGTTIGNACEIALKRGYRQLPTLWAGIVAPPGTAKSPALQAASWPIHALQHAAYERWRVATSAHEADLEQWSATPKHERGPKPVAPALEHLYSTDPTLEALVAMLNSGRGVAIVRDELSGMIGALDKYRSGKGSDLQEYLQLWAGAPIKADRKGGGSTYAVHPVAGICGGVQPDILRGMHDAYGKRNGFIERFLLCVPDVAPANWTEDDLDPTLLTPVVDAFRALRAIAKPDNAERVSIHLSTEARRAWIGWHDANVTSIRRSTGLRQGFLAKMPNQVARIALVLHCLANTDDPRPMIAEATMEDAIAVGSFFTDHLNRVLPLIGDTSRREPVGLDGRILRIVRSMGDTEAGGWVRRSLIYNRLRNIPAPDLSDALAGLEGRGILEKRTVSTDTKPSEQWRISDADHSHYSDYSDYSDYSPSGEHKAGDSLNSPNSPNVVRDENNPELAVIDTRPRGP